MFVSKDGTVTGSIDVSRLDEITPKTDEARAQIDALKAEVQGGQEQAARYAEWQAEQTRGQNPNIVDDDERERSEREQQQDAERQQREADAKQGDVKQGDDAKQAEETQRLQAEAEAAGVTVDKRWGPDRLRQEIEQAKASPTRKQR
jgi:hypothetical protein